MSELEQLFYERYMANKEDSMEVTTMDESFNECAKNLNLKHEEYAELWECNTNCSIMYERQGFMNGFLYAIKILAPIL